MTVVGVAKDVRHFGLDSDARREMFRPYSQAAWPTMTVMVKTATEPLAIAAPASDRALSRIDPDQPVSRIRTMEQVIEESIGSRRFPMLLLGAVLRRRAGARRNRRLRRRQLHRLAADARDRHPDGARRARGAGDPAGACGDRSCRSAPGSSSAMAGSLAASRLLGTLLYRV